MKIAEVPTDRVIQQLLRPDPTRSPGLHLSDILKSISTTLEPDRFGGPLSPVRIAVGLAFEAFLGPALRTIAQVPGERPGEFRRDGILMTPDWIDYDDGVLEEWKATWVSSSQGLWHPKLQHFHRQAKSYVDAVGADAMRFRVLFVNGNYHPPAPELRTYKVTYSRRERNDNWDMVLQHRKDMGL